MMLCAAMPIAMPSEDAGSSVSVVSSSPEITAIILDPAEITLVPGLSVEGTLTVDVFCPNSVDWIQSAVLTKVEPEMGVPMPIPLSLIEVDEERINAKYQLVMELPCNMPAGDYTLTVTVTDRDDNTATASASATVSETLAFSVTDVEFGSVAPGMSSDASSTVTNLGNVRFKFEKKDEIVPSDMSSGSSGIIEAKNIAVDWDWKTVIMRGFFTQDDAIKEVPFTLKVPFGVPPGEYTGRIVFTPKAVK
ncbi:MAG: hypothetical protein KAT65_01295 [Methanophagales archaeon]|nr:hypothetical protein [Methanophagales archaeon]